MQAVSSSYQLDDAKVAISGNLKYQTAHNSGLDFSKILENMSASQENRSRKDAYAIVSKHKSLSKDRINEKTEPAIIGKKDRIDSQSNRPKIKSKREEIRTDSEVQVKRDKRSVEHDFSEKTKISKDNGLNPKQENSAQSSKLVSESELSSEDAELKSRAPKLLSEDVQLSDSSLEVKSVSDNQVVSGSFAKSSEVIVADENITKTLSSGIQEISLQSTNIFSKLSELAKENGIDLTTVDPKVLNDLVYKMSATPLTEFDTSAFENAAVNFLKGDTDALKSFMAADTSSELKQFTASQELLNMLNELDGSIKVNDEKTLFSVTEDFGARDFEVIEDSIKASLNMDEILAREDIKVRIESILDSKKESLQNNLEKSVALLQKVVNGAAAEAELKSEMPAARVDAFAVNPRTFTESGASITTENILSRSFSEQGNNSSMFNQSGQHGLGAFTSMSKTGSEFNLSAMEQSKLDLLNMSSDLKENAKALAMKVMEMSSRNLKSLDLTLNPEGMGKMRIVIDAASAEEITKISISASHSGTRAMLESGIDVLKNLLESNSIFAKTELSEYSEEQAFNGSSSEEFADNSGQNHQQNKENEENQSDNGTIFAGGKIDAEASEKHHIDDNENLNNSQNSNTVSYFA